MTGRNRKAVDLKEVTGLKYSQCLNIVRGEMGMLQNSDKCLGAMQLSASGICRPPFALDKTYACMCQECLG